MADYEAIGMDYEKEAAPFNRKQAKKALGLLNAMISHARFGFSAVGVERSNAQKVGSDGEPSVTFSDLGGARERADGLFSVADKK